MANVTIKNNEGRIVLEIDERISKDLFSLFRSEGWLYSRYQNGFVFKDEESGHQRLQRLLNQNVLNRYGLKEEVKEEFKELVFDFETVEIKEYFTSKINVLEEKKNAEAKAKKEKEEKADENRKEKALKTIETLKKLKNGYGNDKYQLSMHNWNLLEAGIRKQIDVKKTLEKYGLEKNPEYNEDILQIRCYYNYEKDLVVLISGYVRNTGSTFITGGSGHYDLALFVKQNAKKSIKDLIALSEILDEEFEKEIFEYFSMNLYSAVSKMSVFNEVNTYYNKVLQEKIKTALELKAV